MSTILTETPAVHHRKRFAPIVDEPATLTSKPPRRRKFTEAEIRADVAFSRKSDEKARERVFRGRRTFTVCSSVHELYSTSRRGATIAGVLAEQVQDMENGLAWMIARGHSPADAADHEDDVTIWEGTALIAVIRANPAGGVAVTQFAEDEPTEGGRS